MTTGSGTIPADLRAAPAWRSLEGMAGVGSRAQIAIFFFALLLVFSRLPGALLHPQFFAEDGWVWYQQAYNLHWLRSLGIAQAGYLQTLPRLVTGIALLFPMQWAPLIMNLAGAAIQALPVNALLSSRCATWGPLRLRLLMAVLYLAIPNAPEIHIVLTNAMWHLAVLQALMAFALPPASWRGRLSDLLLFGIGSLSGPFCLLLLPSVALYRWLRRSRWTATVVGLMLLGAVAQLITMTHAVRTPGASLGMTWLRLLRIVAGNIFINSMTGGGGAYLRIPLLLLAAGGGAIVMVWAWRNGTLALRLYMLFATFALMASLRDPLLLSNTTPRWEALGHVAGIRYWFLPSLMFLWCGACCALQGRPAAARVAGVGVLLLSTVGLVHKWTYPAWPVSHYRAEVERFHTLKAGQRMSFDIYDPGGRPMELVKR